MSRIDDLRELHESCPRLLGSRCDIAYLLAQHDQALARIAKLRNHLAEMIDGQNPVHPIDLILIRTTLADDDKAAKEMERGDG